MKNSFFLKNGRLYFLCAVLLFCCIGCDHDSFYDLDYGTPGVYSGAIFHHGKNILVGEKILGPDGGILTGPVGTPIAGVSIKFPPGALTEKRTVRYGYNDGTMTPKAGEYNGLCLFIEVEAVEYFERPIIISIPQRSKDTLPTLYHADDLGQLSPLSPAQFDVNNGIFTFLSAHASLFPEISIFTLLYKFNKSFPPSYETGFDPARDGFSVRNFGLDEPPFEGACEGMCTFSLWYYYNKKLSTGVDLHEFQRDLKFPDDLVWRGKKIPFYVQSAIASRAQTSLAGFDGECFVDHSQYLSKRGFIQSLLSMLLNSGPVIVGLSGDHGPGHAVLFIGYHETPGFGLFNSKLVLDFYDPNAPGIRSSTETDSQDRGDFKEHFAGFENWWPIPEDYYKAMEFVKTEIGQALRKRKESFEHIYQDALEEFHGWPLGTIEIWSPPSTPDILEGNECLTDQWAMHFTGYVHSGLLRAERLCVTVNDAPSPQYCVPVGLFDNDPVLDGWFYTDDHAGLLPLKCGWNKIKLDLQDYDCPWKKPCGWRTFSTQTIAPQIDKLKECGEYDTLLVYSTTSDEGDECVMATLDITLIAEVPNGGGVFLSNSVVTWHDDIDEPIKCALVPMVDGNNTYDIASGSFIDFDETYEVFIHYGHGLFWVDYPYCKPLSWTVALIKYPGTERETLELFQGEIDECSDSFQSCAADDTYSHYVTSFTLEPEPAPAL